MDEQERKRIVESGRVYLANGVRAGFAGWKDPHLCTVFGPEPGTKMCSWETAQAVAARPDRRFQRTDALYSGIWTGWGGLCLRRDDFQTEEDWEKYNGPGTKWEDALGE